MDENDCFSTLSKGDWVVHFGIFCPPPSPPNLGGSGPQIPPPPSTYPSTGRLPKTRENTLKKFRRIAPKGENLQNPEASWRDPLPPLRWMLGTHRFPSLYEISVGLPFIQSKKQFSSHHFSTFSSFSASAIDDFL